MVEDTASRKRRIRLEARAARAAITDLDRSRATESVTHLVMGLEGLSDVSLVAVYSAHERELDPSHIVDVLRTRGATIVMPRVTDPVAMSLHEVASDAELVVGHAGILEPSGSTPVVDPEKLDAIIVPGVAFSRTGARVGYGGGYYDRLLARVRGDAMKIGVAFDEQLYEELPIDEHDQAVDVVVTPSGVISPR